MSISERLEKKRAVLAWLDYQRRELRREISQLEEQGREQGRRVAVARAERMWKIEPALAGTPVLHRGGCAMYGGHTDLLSRDQVMAAGERTPELVMCQVCSPWGSLGIDKPQPARKRSGGMS